MKMHKIFSLYAKNGRKLVKNDSFDKIIVVIVLIKLEIVKKVKCTINSPYMRENAQKWPFFNNFLKNIVHYFNKT